MQELVSLQGESGSESVVTTSNLIAEVFGKRHADVLRAIENLLPQLPEDTLRNFAHTDFIDKNGESQRNFTLTRDGFTLIAMGFTGPKALEFKLQYIAAFNAMEKEVQRLHAENQALLKWNLTNCHVAIDTLQDDNGVARRQVTLPLEMERAKNARLDKQIELAKLKAASATYEDVKNLERENAKLKTDVKMWKRGCGTLEERLSTLESICGLVREDSLEFVKKLKLVKS